MPAPPLLYRAPWPAGRAGTGPALGHAVEIPHQRAPADSSSRPASAAPPLLRARGLGSAQLPGSVSLLRAIAWNESFSGWTKTFTAPRLCAVIADRLTFGGSLIQTGTDSYRLAITQARAAARDGKAG